MNKAELIARLTEIGCEEATSEAKTILRELFGVSASVLLTDPERDYENDRLETLLERRAEREPLAYILGEVVEGEKGVELW